MERLYVGTRKGLFTVERVGGAGVPWKVTRAAFVGDPVTIVQGDPSGQRVLAALDHGHFGCKLQRSTDAGATWNEAPMPVFPEKPEGVEDLDPFRKTPIPWSVKLVWSLEAGHPDQEGRLWLGTIPGGLFRSDDHGESWELVRSLWDHPSRKRWVGGGADFAGIHSIVVDPRDGEHVTLGVSVGGVWVTRDGGESWENLAKGMRAEYMPPEQAYDVDAQDPHRVVLCPAAPDVYWAQHHNGIFKSEDDCASWQEIEHVEPSAFGFGVAVDPKDPKVAYFVPAIADQKRYPKDGAVVVNRTRDGGRSFETLREGLPQEHAYDLVYRHALELDSTGRTLAFGSTTGSLWISEDQGDSFMQVSSQLPPIYCVRFLRA